MNHLISYYEKVLAFLIMQKKDEENHRFILENNLNRKGYQFDYEYIKSSINKCRVSEDYYNFLIHLVKQNQMDLIRTINKTNCCEQVTISLNNNG